MRIINIDGVGDVTITKSARAKRVILKITAEGTAVVTIPRSLPYALGVRYAKLHRDWLIKNGSQHRPTLLTEGKAIGRQHRLHFRQVASYVKATTRVQSGLITIDYYDHEPPEHPATQMRGQKAAVRALKKEADAYLPGRIYTLSQSLNYHYNQITVKKMRSRWGSCSSEGVIALSIWLMQLPSDLIDYVLCHELVHLHHAHHQPDFWQELTTILPDARVRQKALKAYQPRLM